MATARAISHLRVKVGIADAEFPPSEAGRPTTWQEYPEAARELPGMGPRGKASSTCLILSHSHLQKNLGAWGLGLVEPSLAFRLFIFGFYFVSTSSMNLVSYTISMPTYTIEHQKCEIEVF